mmetsp:Transcript_31006/g.68781  ORF Transcript_31006/g.68781 Transcript_31006/m.68781 type:complete len:205 (-) Transcript_31006:646-1260(-)
MHQLFHCLPITSASSEWSMPTVMRMVSSGYRVMKESSSCTVMGRVGRMAMRRTGSGLPGRGAGRNPAYWISITQPRADPSMMGISAPPSISILALSTPHASSADSSSSTPPISSSSSLPSRVVMACISSGAASTLAGRKSSPRGTMGSGPSPSHSLDRSTALAYDLRTRLALLDLTASPLAFSSSASRYCGKVPVNSSSSCTDR